MPRAFLPVDFLGGALEEGVALLFESFGSADLALEAFSYFTVAFVTFFDTFVAGDSRVFTGVFDLSEVFDFDLFLVVRAGGTPADFLA